MFCQWLSEEFLIAFCAVVTIQISGNKPILAKRRKIYQKLQPNEVVINLVSNIDLKQTFKIMSKEKC